MNLQDITTIFNLFEQSDAAAMKLTQGDFSLELTRGGTSVAVTSPAVAPPVEQAIAPKAVAEGKTVNAPLIGTYYAAPTPESDPFVAVGQQVKRGETLCLIEAMKMMSEVPAPCDCVVEELLQENGALLAFDAPILRYRAV